VSLSGEPSAVPADPPGRLASGGRTLGLAVAALAVVLLAGAALSLATGPLAPPPPPKNPFGVGLREGGGSAGGIVGWILATQADFYRRLTAAVRASTAGPDGAWLLVGLSFLYGVFHAAGPGHGKAVVSAWIMANEKALGRGVLLAFAAAAVQAVVAIALVGTLSVALRVTAVTMTRVTGAVETASFVAVALVGAALLWSKAGALAARLWPASAPRHAHAPGEPCGPGCGHAHMPDPAAATAPWRSAAGAVLAAGLRPCTGAIIVLVFALSQGVFATGILATFAMALGTALLTGSLAALSVFFKQAALRLAATRGVTGGALAGAMLETLAAAAVLAFGLALLAGLSASLG
jgi:nickel/cobalt transporter (NicO) family protein